MRPERARVIRRVRIGVCAALAVAVLIYAFVEGRHLDRTKPDAKLGAAPLVGRWEWRPSLRSLLAVGVAVLIAVVLPRVVARASVRVVVGVSGVASALFGWALAINDGWSAVIAPVIHPTEYWAGVARAKPITTYLSTYVERGLFHSVHVRGHPPGMMVVLIAMKRAHLHSPWAAAGLSIISVAVTVFALGFTVARLDGPEVARRAAPLLAVTPFAIWQVTSADAFFAATAAVGLACIALALTARGEPAVLVSALAGGLLFGFLLHLTYGATTLAPVGLALLLLARSTMRRRSLVAVGTAVGVAAVFLTFRAAGFWWFDGFQATRHHYWAGTAKFRPAVYFAIANLAVLAIALGPAASSAFIGLRLRAVDGEPAIPRSCWLAFAAAVGVALADASQYSKGETERIWLIFMPWLTLAGIGWVTTSTRLRWWIGVQAVTALVLQNALISKW